MNNPPLNNIPNVHLFSHVECIPFIIFQGQNNWSCDLHQPLELLFVADNSKQNT